MAMRIVKARVKGKQVEVPMDYTTSPKAREFIADKYGVKPSDVSGVVPTSKSM